MKTILPSLVGFSLLAFSSSLFAGQPGLRRADLDGDGKEELITWSQFDETEDEGEFYQFRVYDDDGNTLLWEGPKSTNLDDPFVIGRWHFGISLPEVVADIDLDGSVELIIPQPISDVSPVSYKVFRWAEGKFTVLRYGVLLEVGKGSGNFPWSESDQYTGTWISGFQGVEPDGRLRVSIMSYDGGASSGSGVALVKPTREGFQVSEWIEPLASFSSGEDTAAPVTTAPTMPIVSAPPANTPVPNRNAYRARLSNQDHFSSTGTQLMSVIQILRQDRANYHKGMGDPEDGPDATFGTLQGRNIMEDLTPAPVGMNRSSWERAILYSTPLVDIEVVNDSILVEIVQ